MTQREKILNRNRSKWRLSHYPYRTYRVSYMHKAEKHFYCRVCRRCIDKEE